VDLIVFPRTISLSTKHDLISISILWLAYKLRNQLSLAGCLLRSQAAPPASGLKAGDAEPRKTNFRHLTAALADELDITAVLVR
jgi:hypothetical protein